MLNMMKIQFSQHVCEKCGHMIKIKNEYYQFVNEKDTVGVLKANTDVDRTQDTNSLTENPYIAMNSFNVDTRAKFFVIDDELEGEQSNTKRHMSTANFSCGVRELQDSRTADNDSSKANYVKLKGGCDLKQETTFQTDNTSVTDEECVGSNKNDSKHASNEFRPIRSCSSIIEGRYAVIKDEDVKPEFNADECSDIKSQIQKDRNAQKFELFSETSSFTSGYRNISSDRKSFSGALHPSTRDKEIPLPKPKRTSFDPMFGDDCLDVNFDGATSNEQRCSDEPLGNSNKNPDHLPQIKPRSYTLPSRNQFSTNSSHSAPNLRASKKAPEQKRANYNQQESKHGSKCALCEIVSTINIKHVVDKLWAVGAVKDSLYNRVTFSELSIGQQNLLWQELVAQLNRLGANPAEKAIKSVCETLEKSNTDLSLRLRQLYSINKKKLRCLCIRRSSTI